jgi:hypothetical protein
MSPNAWLEMNPKDAIGLSLKQHDKVTPVSRRGRVPERLAGTQDQ